MLQNIGAHFTEIGGFAMKKMLKMSLLDSFSHKKMVKMTNSSETLHNYREIFIGSSKHQ